MSSSQSCLYAQSWTSSAFSFLLSQPQCEYKLPLSLSSCGLWQKFKPQVGWWSCPQTKTFLCKHQLNHFDPNNSFCLLYHFSSGYASMFRKEEKKDHQFWSKWKDNACTAAPIQFGCKKWRKSWTRGSISAVLDHHHLCFHLHLFHHHLLGQLRQLHSWRGKPMSIILFMLPAMHCCLTALFWLDKNKCVLF